MSYFLDLGGDIVWNGTRATMQVLAEFILTKPERSAIVDAALTPQQQRLYEAWECWYFDTFTLADMIDLDRWLEELQAAPSAVDHWTEVGRLYFWGHLAELREKVNERIQQLRSA